MRFQRGEPGAGLGGLVQARQLTRVSVLSLPAPLGRSAAAPRCRPCRACPRDADLDDLPVGKQLMLPPAASTALQSNARRHGEAAALGVALGARRGADGVGRLLLQQGSSPCSTYSGAAALQVARVGQGDLHARQCIAALAHGIELNTSPFMSGT
jgi:hypothetical protein